MASGSITSVASAPFRWPAASSVRASTSSRSIRARELSEDATPAPFLLGALERPLQLSAELVHAGVEALDHLGNPLVRRPVGPPADDEQDEKEHHESAETHADPNKQVRRRHNPAAVKKPALPTDCSGGLSR
jgi:hypothetical protein